MANYYRNENRYFVEIPIYTNGTVTIKPGEFVKGSSFARQAALGIIVDKGAGEPSEVTANPALLIFTQDENAGVAVGSSIQTAEIDNLAVTTGKINDLAVTEGKIAALAVTEGKIGALAVTEGKIGALAVTEGKIGALAVTAGKLGGDAVTTAKILNSAVTATKVDLSGTPTAADDAGLAGSVKFDATYVYLCTAPDTWIRFAHGAITWA